MSNQPQVPKKADPAAGRFQGLAQEADFARVETGPRRRIQKKRVVLCVTGSVAAYKAAILLRLLRQEGASIDVVLSRNAKRFVGTATFTGLNTEPVFSEMFGGSARGELHVELGKQADLIAIVPASADLLARIAQGRANDLISALCLCARCPILAAPAMHPTMWEHPATQRNVQLLKQDRRVEFVGPAYGEVASGDVGLGRMAEPEAILNFAIARLTPQALQGRRIVITAGPTTEALDPVRALGNRSSGKMGFALAERARMRGAEVLLIAGPVQLSTPPGVQRVDVESALSMQAALRQALQDDLSGADALIMSAAVADYRPAQPSSTKLKRGGEPLVLELLPNPDLLAEIGQARIGALPALIGFALETVEEARLIEYARAKRAAKRVDLMVANRAQESLGLPLVRATLVGPDFEKPLAPLSKEDAADEILDWLADRLDALKGGVR